MSTHYLCPHNVDLVILCHKTYEQPECAGLTTTVGNMRKFYRLFCMSASFMVSKLPDNKNLDKMLVLWQIFPAAQSSDMFLTPEMWITFMIRYVIFNTDICGLESNKEELI